jgi:hypothetical protein
VTGGGGVGTGGVLVGPFTVLAGVAGAGAAGGAAGAGAGAGAVTEVGDV